MVIREIYIDGFGIFSNYHLSLPGAGIHIILGNNEAGKSTLMKFIRYTLFGNSSQKRIEPLAGGNPGGRIKVQLLSGEEVIFGRDGKNKPHLVADSTAGKWEDYLGNASDKLFNKIYSFTTDELVSMGSINESGMADKIFSLGMGLGNISISTLEDNIRCRVDEIYKGGKVRKHLVSSLLTQIKDMQSDIKYLGNSLVNYRSLVREIEFLETETGRTDIRLKQLRQEHTLLDVYLRCYESFVMLKHAEQELDKLPTLAMLPERGIQKMENALESQAKYRQHIIELQQGTGEEKGTEDIENEINSLLVNGHLMEHKESVNYLRNSLSTYIQILEEKGRESKQLSELNDRISKYIVDKINSRWNENDVESFTDQAANLGRREHYIDRLSRATEEKRNWEAQERVLLNTSPGINTEAIAKIMMFVFLTGALPLFLYGLHWAGAAMVLIAGIIFAGRKVFKKEDKVTPVRKRIEELTTEQEEILKSYRNWLQNDLKLSPELSFPVLLNVFQAIEQVKSMIEQRNILRKIIQEERLPRIVDYEARVRALAKILSPDAVNIDVVFFVKVLSEEFDRDISIVNYSERLKSELTTKINERKRAEEQLKICKESVDSLLKAVGVESVSDFFARYKVNDQVKNLLEVRKNAFEKIETVAGINKADEVISYLSSHDKQSIQHKLYELDASIGETENKLGLLKEEKGSKVAEKERLAGESELSQKLTQLETLRQKLNEVYREWISGQLALRVLNRVKADYEKYKQPAVITNAGSYFQAITKGRYSGIRASLEGQEVNVFDKTEAMHTLEQLSRGTKEQLLVSLRLGFIEEYERQAEPLPVVVDEILVNFDRERARETASILLQFSRSRQVLLFTCHQETVSLFDEGKINVVRL